MPLNFPITPQLAQPHGSTTVAGLENYLRFFLRDLQQYLHELGLSLSTVDLTDLGVSAFAQTLLDDADAATARTTLGVGAGDSPTFTALTLSNGQIVFPATQVPSAGANTLDDYEEGTWTPTYHDSGGPTMAATTNNASYTKIGRFVSITYDFLITNTGGGTAYVVHTNPFASVIAGGGGGREAAVVGYWFADIGPASLLMYNNAVTNIVNYRYQGSAFYYA